MKTVKTIVGVYAKYLVPILMILVLILPFVLPQAGISYGTVPAYKTLIYQGGDANLGTVNITTLNPNAAGTGNFTTITVGTAVSGNGTTLTDTVAWTHSGSNNFSGTTAISALGAAAPGTANVSTLTATTGTITTGTVTTLSSTTGTITTLGATSPGTANVTTLTAATGTITTLGAATPGSGNFTTLNASTIGALGATAAGTANITTLTVSGTPVFANHSSGVSTNISASASSVVVTHSMSGTPTQVFLTFKDGIPGTATSSTAANSLYWSAANSTNFTINLGVSSNTTVAVNWLAFILGE